MSMDEHRLQKAIASWVDGSISPTEKSELEIVLRKDEAARQIYLQHMSVHAELCSLESAYDYFESINKLENHSASEPNACKPNTSKPNAISPANSHMIHNRLPLAIAVSILLAVLLWQDARLLWQDSSKWNFGSMAEAAAVRMLDDVEPVSKNCDWYVEQARRDHVISYSAGDVIRVTKGQLKLRYTHGTTVVLHAPVAYQLMTSMKARVLLGRLTANVTEPAKGFSVLTPRATVVDLGTEFGVEVNNDGATDVVVFKGEVDVDYNDHTDRSSAQRLRMGEAVHLDAIGTASRIVSINGRRYSSDKALKSPSRKAVIAEVHDNIERTSSLMSYYEIVPQGMQEDSLAFVDRIAHEWNGITEQGMPEYLIGADYVKTFNSDKFNPDLQVSIKLKAACKLYVLFDNRLPIPAWLSRDFRDTGDDLGMDTGPYQTKSEFWHNQGPSGVGPGKSVEDTLSVWEKVVSEPGVVFLGSTEAPISAPNMYGIAAVPSTVSEQVSAR